MYFPTPKELNDPFEANFGSILPLVVTAFETFSCLNKQDQKTHSYNKIYKELLKYNEEHGNCDNFKDNYLLNNSLTSIQKGKLSFNSNNYKICSFTPYKDEILMWSYYGQEHRGVCLEYDSMQIISALKNFNGNSNSLFLFGEVKYDANRPTYNKLINLYYYLSNDIIITLLIINVLFTKYKKWSHEDEYRFVIVDTSSIGGVVLNVKINGFYLGCNANLQLIKNLKNSNKKLSKAKMDNNEYKLHL